MNRKRLLINWWNKPRWMDLSVAAWVTLIISLSLAILANEWINTGGTGVWISR